MGSKCDHHSLHSKNLHQKTIFLPMFCRLSIKDIKVNNHHKDQISVLEEPASPKVSCIGQVKRNKRVTGRHAYTYSPDAASTSTNHHKLAKQKRLFSSKTLLPTTTNGGAGSGIRSYGTNVEVGANNRSRMKLLTDGCGEGCVKVVDIGDLDPPLPVVQRAAPPLVVGEDETNIWKRRCNGAALKRLQIQQLHLPNNNFQPPPSV